MATIYQVTKTGRACKSYTTSAAGDLEYIGGGMFIGAVGNQVALFKISQATGTIDIIKVFLTLLGGSVVGVTYDGVYVWTLTQNITIPVTYSMAKVDWNGRTIFSVSFGSTILLGLCRDTFDANNFESTRGSDAVGFYMINKTANPDRIIHRVVNKKNVRNVKAFATTSDLIQGVTFDGVYLWAVTSDATNALIQMDLNGRQIKSISGISTSKGITTDGNYLYISST